MPKIEKYYKGTKFERRPWQKEELVKLVKVWNDHTYEELANQFQRPILIIKTIGAMFRKQGVKLHKKFAGAYGIRSMIEEVVAEL